MKRTVCKDMFTKSLSVNTSFEYISFHLTGSFAETIIVYFPFTLPATIAYTFGRTNTNGNIFLNMCKHPKLEIHHKKIESRKY